MSLNSTPSSVLTAGFGVWGSAALVVTFGYGVPAQTITQGDFWLPGVTEAIDVLPASTETVDVLLLSTETVDVLVGVTDDRVV